MFILSKDITGKDQGKANYANAFIGFGIKRPSGMSSTGIYAKNAKKYNIPVNIEINPTTNTVAFVSVSREGKYVNETFRLALHIITNGGTVIMDPSGTLYAQSHSDWNINGEGAVQDLLKIAIGEPEQTLDGYNYWKICTEQEADE